ncbi:helix-turn-helix domain-containing protein [Chryseobacterium sp. MYb264]|uniref:helix-turn-helix domain-containing protein n=1 Tax=Chryseobacterium sp. MYb264 TaxID=2745153 RepID=UPI002E0FC3AA|nr:helix-turn-helix domain-containing protein [Chryseobacterium sp. MYb264]
MNRIVNFDTVDSYNKYGGQTTVNPLVSIVDLSEGPLNNYSQLNVGLYIIVFKDKYCGEIEYGRSSYDYNEGALLFFSPGQVIRLEETEELNQPKGYALAFHPDFLHRTSLLKNFHEYTFFNYAMKEALYMSENEQTDILDCFARIKSEIERPIDQHSKRVIISAIELLLSYCIRFYDRQFITREKMNYGILEKFEELLRNYYQSDLPSELGLPSVNYCASELFLSPNYFGDLIKKETGKTAHEYIQNSIINLAKSKVADPAKSLSEIAYELGFKNPSHFSKLFKQKTGRTPQEYRMKV